MQPSFFGLDDRHRKLNERDPLVALRKLIDWEDFRSTLNKILTLPRKSNAGRRPFDKVLMFKALVLQHLYNLSDDELEYQIRDRFSFCRFLSLNPEDRTPDAKTIWLFRERLVKAGLMKSLFMDFNCQLEAQGYKAQKGQIIDASFINAPKQRNNREENKEIRAGKVPKRIAQDPNVKRQKDLDARWTRKNNERYYGYKDHVCIDNKHKLIREYEVTSAEVHDSQVFIELLGDNSSKDVWADSAYYSEECEVALDVIGYRSHVHKKGCRGKPLSECEKEVNHRKSKVRARVEHVFGSMENEQGGMFVRTIGLARANVKVGMMNLVYNMRRFVSLYSRVAPAT
ncbi:IS5 family transposase [Microbulbifer sp. TRSA007]|uniref:IS5 family transposase n=1 Tax=Microbulbifer sp. TRSA007 TaxID=3243384 RepID=UPI004038FE6A